MLSEVKVRFLPFPVGRAHPMIVDLADSVLGMEWERRQTG